MPFRKLKVARMGNSLCRLGTLGRLSDLTTLAALIRIKTYGEESKNLRMQFNIPQGGIGHSAQSARALLYILAVQRMNNSRKLTSRARSGTLSSSPSTFSGFTTLKLPLTCSKSSR